MNATRSQWLIIGGPLAGYTFDLFREVVRNYPVDVRFLHDPLETSSQFAHEVFESGELPSLRWRQASVPQLLSFVLRPYPHAIFVFGTEARVPATLALLALRRVPVLFVSDVNVAHFMRNSPRFLLKALGYAAFARRVDLALSLGITNTFALKSYGVRNILELPMYTVDFRGTQSAAMPAPADTPDRVRIILIARLVWEKNIASVIAAIGKDEGLSSRVELIIVGDGPERDAIARACANAPSLSVRLVGALPRSEVGALLSTAEALLIPSVQEQWGIVVLEALAMGIPVIATPAVGAALSLAGITQAVILSETSDASDVPRALHTFLHHRNELRSAAKHAAAFVRSKYDRRRVAARLVEVVGRLHRDCAEVQSS